MPAARWPSTPLDHAAHSAPQRVRPSTAGSSRSAHRVGARSPPSAADAARRRPRDSGNGADGMDSGPSPWTAWYSAWLSLNIHLHMLFVDGVYTFDEERPRFHRGSAPTQPELQRLLRTIATRVTRALEGQGLLIRDDETPLPRPRTRRRIRATPRCRRPLPHRHRPPRQVLYRLKHPFRNGTTVVLDPRAQGPDPAHRRVPPARRQPLHRSALGILPPCRHALPSP